MEKMSFNLNIFITECKKHVPNYFKILIKENTSKLEINESKNVISSFIKEYIKNNNSKFDRTRFNVKFINKFIYKFIPEFYPDLYTIPISKLQTILLNFTNYLSLQQVLTINLQKEIINSIQNIPLKQEKDANNSLENINIYNPHEYSEKYLEKLLDRTEKLTESFLKSEYSKNLNTKELEFTNGIIIEFTEAMYAYHLQNIENWTPYALECTCLDIFPRKVCAITDYFKATYPVLTVYFSYLNNRGVLTMDQTTNLKMKLYEISDLIVEYASNPENWNFSKSLLMEAAEKGIDFENEKELDTFLKLKTFQHNLKAISLLRRERVDKYTNEEIFQKLWDYGITITKDQFLESVHKNYSLNQLVKNWKRTFNITPEAIDTDFVWISAEILWKRLAPEVINLEHLEDLIMEGYDLSGKMNHEKACITWQEVWGYIKNMDWNEIRINPDIDDFYKDSYFISDWSQDFMMELWNAGLCQDLIIFCEEILELLPESDNLFIHNVLRYRADSLFFFGKLESGEKAFEALVEQFPENPWGYIGWGDQYADFRRNYFDFNKAKSLFLKGMEKDHSEEETILRRIEMLEDDKEKFELRNQLLLEYNSYLTKKNLSEQNSIIKKEHAKDFLNKIISQFDGFELEDFFEFLNLEQILFFLGFWSIRDNIAKNKSSLYRLCQSIKIFMQFLQEEFEVFSINEMKEIKQLLNSKEFFLECLEEFNGIHSDNKNFRKRFSKWSSKYLEWYDWNKKK
jgi:hypothetical protein